MNKKPIEDLLAQRDKSARHSPGDLGYGQG